MNFDWSVVWEYRAALLHGASVTVLLTCLSMAFAIPGGIVLALMRLSPIRLLRVISAIFVEFCRNIPLVLVVYWAYYVLPVFSGISTSAFATGLFGLAVYCAAYNSETFRAGINSIRKGQTEVGLALGLSRWQIMREIVLPQSFKRILPILASTWVALFKDTAIVSLISVNELAYTALEIRSNTFRVLEMLTAMMVIYWLMGYPQAKLVDWMYRRWRMAE